MPAEPEISGRFVVLAADADALMLRAVDSARVLTLIDPPAFDRWTVLDATLVSADALGLTMRAAAVEDHFTVALVAQDERPTTRSRAAAATLPAGGSTFLPRQDAGGTDVIALAAADHTAARQQLAADVEPIVLRAARLDVRRVELRSAPGVLTVRYLP
ncbi:MAG: DUF5812 family protein [Haloquadratum sp.]|jgi:voltage-gated potassium channel Kch|nr:DUF5812 family protein [Haloferacaceae archaeon]MDR9445386.1 DUF5812 family protein [Haloquadratum sp.]